MERTELEEVAVRIADELQARGLLADTWEDGMTISRNLYTEKAIIEAASVIEWVLRTGNRKVVVR